MFHILNFKLNLVYKIFELQCYVFPFVLCFSGLEDGEDYW